MKLFLALLLLIPTLGHSVDAADFSTGLTNLGNAPVPEKTAAPLPATQPGSGYTLGGGDKVRLTVFGEDDLTGQYDVDGTGTLALPLIGTLNVMGKTPREAEALITARYASGYLTHPRVSLEVLNFRPFFILGEVNKPGSYPHVNNLTVINAVALAGGYTARASTGKVLIRRAGGSSEVSAPESAPVNPGDAIRVEERFF